ncbi:MAG: substrate-binding domain-containing protein [Eubacteriales bacterium]
MRRKIVFIVIAIFVMLVIICFMCKESTDSVQKTPIVTVRNSSVEIGVSLYGMVNDSEKSFIESIINVSNTLGLDSKIFEGDSNSSNQISHMQQLIEQGVNGIILSPYNEEVAQACIDMALDVGMPVVLVDSATDYLGASGYIAHDLKLAGNMLVDAIAEELDGKGNVVILEDIIGLTTQEEKRAGIDEALLKYPDLNVISSKSANGLEIEANAIMSKWLTQFDQIDAVICENDEMALGVYQAIEDENLDIIIGSIGGTDEGELAVEEGKIAVSVREDIEKKGELAMQTIIGIILGEDVNDEYILPLRLITSEVVVEE